MGFCTKIDFYVDCEYGLYEHHKVEAEALAELEKKKLVKCLTPKAVTGRIYALTTLGKEVLTKLMKSNQ